MIQFKNNINLNIFEEYSKCIKFLDVLNSLIA